MGDDDLEAALAASRSQLAELEVRAQTRANAVAEAAAVAASEAEAMHATEATFVISASDAPTTHNPDKAGPAGPADSLKPTRMADEL